MAHQAYIGGAPCWGAPRHSPTGCSPQICPIFINLSCFHQIFLINWDLLMNLGEIWWESGGNLAVLGLGSHRPNHVGRGFVGKNLHEARAKSRREGIRRQKSPARARVVEIFVVGQISRGARARAKPRRGAEIPRARLRTRIIKVIPVWIFFSRPGLDLPLPMPSQAKARWHFAIREPNGGLLFRFFG